MRPNGILLALAVIALCAVHVGTAQNPTPVGGVTGPAHVTRVLQPGTGPASGAAPPVSDLAAVAPQVRSGSAGAGLTITPTFDATITGDPNAASIENTINTAIAIYQAKFSDPITVTIKFAGMATGLGQSDSFFCTLSYNTFLTALAADAKSASDTSALALLPSSSTNPVNGNAQINVKSANLRAVGITACSVPSPEATISLNLSLTSPGLAGTNGSYSLLATVEHEIDEVLGLGSTLPDLSASTIFPEDLFRYDQNNSRTLTTTSTVQAFFSLNGSTHLAQFDNQNDGGDFGDWQSNPLPSGVAPKVQDAFATSGATPTLGTELTALDVIGYDLVTGNGSTVAATPSSLRFGATKAGAAGALTAVTAAQTVTVSFSGGSSAWTASADQPWVQIGGGSGSGGGSFTVAVSDPTNKIGGSTSLSATVTLTAALAGNSPVTIPVTLTVDQTGVSTQPAFGQVDTPAQSATAVVGAIGVTGWVVDDVGIRSVKIYRNCLTFENQASCQVINGNNVVFVGDAAFVAGARPDVEAAFSSYPASNVAGWGYLLLTNMLPHVTGQLGYGGQGTLSLYVFATDLEGHVTLLGRAQTDHAPTTITMDNDHIAKPFGAIDTPSQGGTVSGTFANFGWVLTPDANTVADGTDILMPTSGATMVVYIDGVGKGTVAYNQCRGNVGNPVPAGLYCNDDVASIFGNPTPQATFTTRTSNPTLFRNLDAGRSAIGAFNIDTTKLSNGIHSIAWGVSDSAGRGEGIGSRNFFVLNAGADASIAFDLTAAAVSREAYALMMAPAQSRGDTSLLPAGVATGAHVYGRTGFDVHTPLEAVTADANGLRLVRMPDMGRLELHLGNGVDAGYTVVGDTLRDLPVGSHLDGTTGTFTWAPAPGYLGTYHLVFVVAGQRVPIDVTVQPMTPTPAGQSEIRMNVDLPIDGATVQGPITIAGWALDPQAWTGSGIGAVHVWAYPRDTPSTGPQFVGAAALDAARPDVAGAFGAQFGRAGFGLTTSALAPGTYDLVVYAWCDRTGRWEDARTVHVTIR